MQGKSRTSWWLTLAAYLIAGVVLTLATSWTLVFASDPMSRGDRDFIPEGAAFDAAGRPGMSSYMHRIDGFGSRRESWRIAARVRSSIDDPLDFEGDSETSMLPEDWSREIDELARSRLKARGEAWLPLAFDASGGSWSQSRTMLEAFADGQRGPIVEVPLHERSGVDVARRFPFLAMRCAWRRSKEGSPLVVSGGFDISGGYLPDSPEDKLRAVPLTPIASGFALNTLVYAAVVWLVVRMRQHWTRYRRLLRGLCPLCRYDINGAVREGCPECGWRRDEAAA